MLCLLHRQTSCTFQRRTRMFWRLRLGIFGLFCGGMLLIAGYRRNGSWGRPPPATPEELTLEALIARGPDGNPNVRVRDFVLGDNYAFCSDDSGSCWIERFGTRHAENDGRTVGPRP